MDHQTSGPLSSVYFERYAIRERLSQQLPATNPAIVITIPALCEESLLACLNSLAKCRLPLCQVEVLILLNEPEDAEEIVKKNNREIFLQTEKWIAERRRTQPLFSVFHRSLPKKHAGVGLARKILMDEAAWRLDQAGLPDGIIVALDADCTVEENYLTCIYDYFQNHPESNGAGIYFEHPLSGPLSQDHYQAIAGYELHLRYLVHAQRYAGARYAYQTVGSAMAVRNATYQAVGGMNRRKAGEDFYFLHKIFPAGFGEITETCLYPSPRISTRVPFGTGKAMEKLLTGNQPQCTYSPESVKLLRQFYRQVLTDGPETIPEPLLVFLRQQAFRDEIDRMKRHSPTPEQFQRHFHRWFDGFLLIKALHYLRDHHVSFRSVPVKEAAYWLAEQYSEPPGDDLLRYYRKLDRKVN